MASEDDLSMVVIEPVEQKTVALMQVGDDEVLAARTATSEIYLQVHPIRAALGIKWATQCRKIKADEILLPAITISCCNASARS